MGFASHQTFHLRSGWLAKALDEIGQHHQDSFSEEASIRLGIGKNMVRSLKFWTRAVGFVEFHGNDLDLSRFARIVKKEDPYLEDDTTWWMIHYFLVTQPDEATSWYYLFNEFGRSEFVKEELVRSISDYSATVLGRQLSESSFIKDVDCILATYVESSEQRGTPEDNIVCPLSRLGLLSQSRSGVIAKSSPGNACAA